MQHIVCTNEFGSIEFGVEPPYILQNPEGISGLTSRTQTQQGYLQDGDTRLSNSDEKRFLTLDIMIMACSHNDLELKKRFIQKMFNPKVETELLFNNDNFSSRLKVYAESRPRYTTDKSYVTQQMILRLVAHQPYYEGEELTESMLTEIKNFEFPVEFSPAIEFSTQGDSLAVIENDGDVPTPVTLEFTGPAQNPKITNLTTEEFVKVERTLLAEEKLIVTTEYGNKKVLFDDGAGNITNSFGFISDDTVFFQLEVGTNEIKYTADTGVETAEATIKWRERFAGY